MQNINKAFNLLPHWGHQSVIGNNWWYQAIMPQTKDLDKKPAQKHISRKINQREQNIKKIVVLKSQYWRNSKIYIKYAFAQSQCSGRATSAHGDCEYT